MDMKSKAKMDVLKQIRDIASQCMKDDLKAKGLKKVSVASDSTEGLEAGLDKAKEMLMSGSAMKEAALSDDMGPDMEEAEEESEGEMPEEESEASLDEQIKALQEKKHKLMMSK